MTYKKLSDLTTKGQTWSIKVKVIRVWDMILMDEQVIFFTNFFVCVYYPDFA